MMREWDSGNDMWINQGKTVGLLLKCSYKKLYSTTIQKILTDYVKCISEYMLKNMVRKSYNHIHSTNSSLISI